MARESRDAAKVIAFEIALRLKRNEIAHDPRSSRNLSPRLRDEGTNYSPARPRESMRCQTSTRLPLMRKTCSRMGATMRAYPATQLIFYFLRNEWGMEGDCGGGRVFSLPRSRRVEFQRGLKATSRLGRAADCLLGKGIRFHYLRLE